MKNEKGCRSKWLLYGESGGFRLQLQGTVEYTQEGKVYASLEVGVMHADAIARKDFQNTLRE